MLPLVWAKIINEKLLNCCLFAGVCLLIAVFCCHPLLEKGADNQLIIGQFEDYAKENNRFPAVFSREFDWDENHFESTDNIFDGMREREEEWLERVSIDPVASQQFITLSQNAADTSLGKNNLMLRIGTMGDMESHISIQKGSPAGAGSCMISEQTMDAYGLTVGETISFPHCKDSEGNPATLTVAGIFQVKSLEDPYWYEQLSDLKNVVWVDAQEMDDLIADYGIKGIRVQQVLLLDYTQIDWKHEQTLAEEIQNIKDMDAEFSTQMGQLLSAYEEQKQNVERIIWVLELPCVILLSLFIYMAEAQLIRREESVIAVMRSRGATKRQIMQTYMLQMCLLAGLAIFPGGCLSYFMCQLAAHTEVFLQFTRQSKGGYPVNGQMIGYVVMAIAFTLLLTAAALWRKADQTILEQKIQSVSVNKKEFWHKYLLDILLLLLSLYLLFNYNQQKETLAMHILQGKPVDPVLFLDAELFLVAVGLVGIRFTRYLVCLINRMGRRHWKAATYASFLQITRTFAGQTLVALFLIVTIAGGIFDAAMARTMNQNITERIRYEDGCGVRLENYWKMHTMYQKDGIRNQYYEEPDYGVYDQLMDQDIASSMTKVIMDENVMLTVNNHHIDNCRLYGIHTKEFGQTADLKNGLNKKHWFYALNALAKQSDGVIISRNLAEEYDLKEGDRILYSRYWSKEKKEEDCMGTASVTVCAIIESFPGFVQYRYVKNSIGELVQQEQYLLVANIAQVNQIFGTTPYELWIRLAAGADARDVQQFAEKNNMKLSKWIDCEADLAEACSSTLIQITNGLFTLSFLVSMLVCVAGFLISQVISLNRRELLIGIYRAMGMKLTEIRWMLIQEQLCSTIPAVAAGIAAGAVSVALFVGLIAVVYLPQQHNVWLQVYVNVGDFLKIILVLVLMFALCAWILRMQLRRMNIAQALKLGED